MERLTFEENGSWGIKGYDIRKVPKELYGALCKLRDYERSGFSPGQVIECAEKCKELAKLQKGYLSGIELAQIWAELEKLKEYRTLEEQGKLLRLPCAVGDTIYIVLHNHTITQRKVIRFKMIAKGWAAEVSDWFYLFDEFGKTVFLTQEEAEAALKEL